MANTKIQSEQIADSAIVTDRIAADAVTTAKIADNVALGGSPTTTTQSASDNSTKIATTAYVTAAVADLIDSAPSTLNTLNEIAAALNDDANFNTTVTNSIAAKLPLAGGTMTGALNMGTQNITNTGTIASGAITTSAVQTFTKSDYGDFSTEDFFRIKFQDQGGITNDVGIGQFQSGAMGFNVTQGNQFRFNEGTDGEIARIGPNGIDARQGGLRTNGTTRIDASGNLSNIGTISSGAITASGGNANNTDDANILTLNASQHARLLVDTSSTSGHRATLALESNGNETTLSTTGSASFLNVDTGDLTLDVADDIILDSGNAEIHLKASGTMFGKLFTSGNDFYINNPQQDEDIMFSGNDGGSTITALTLDMSAAGAATFNGRINPGEHIIFQAGNGYLQFPGTSSRAWAIASQGGTAAPGTQSATFGFHHWSGSAWSNPINITASGKLGVGTDNPSYELDVQGSPGDVAIFRGDANNTIRTYLGSGYQIFQAVNSGTTSQFGYGPSGFYIQTNGNNTALEIDSNQRLGIGVSNNAQTRVDILGGGTSGHALQVRGTSNGSDDTTLTKGIRAVTANANNWAGLQMSASYLRFSHQDSSSDFEVHPTGVYIGDNGSQGTFAYNQVAGLSSGGSASSYSSTYSAAQTVSTQSIAVDSFKTVGTINTRAYASYINIKTNLTANNIMFLAHFLGYNYNYGNKEFYSGGYTYTSNSILAKSNMTEFGGNSSTIDSYRASDGALCFKLYMNQTGYTEGYMIFRFHSHNATTTRNCTIAAVQIRNDGTNHFA